MAVKKIKLMQQRLENTMAKRKGDDYGHGIAITDPQERRQTKTTKTTVVRASVGRGQKRRVPTQCKCTRTDHLRISFKDCPLNPKNIARLQEKAAARKG